MTVDALALARTGGGLFARNPLKYARLNAAQRAVARDASKRKLWRDANQFLGKSYYLAWDILHRLRGTHPYVQSHRAPIRALVISVSLDQMLPLMEKLWMLAPKDELAPNCGFEPGRGITGKPPRLVFTSGPGAGSVLTFATYKQGATRIAGGTYHLVAMDEPPTESMYGEVLPRVARLNGDIIITMTPTPDMPDVSWLRKLVEEGQFSEHNFTAKEQYCWLEGALAPYATQDAIDAFAASLLPHERAMRVEGAWEPLVTGRWLTHFTRDRCLSEQPPLPGARLAVGIDHGAAAGKQAAVLMAVEDGDTPRVWYWDESQSDGFTTPAQDAAAILAMLRRNGLDYDHIDEWIGDRPTGDNRFMVAKDNKALQSELARALRREISSVQRIKVPHKFSGSVTYGLRLMNGLFASDRATVHPRCVKLIESMEKFAGDKRDKVKDILDAARYPTELLVRPSAVAPVTRAHF